VHIVNWLIIRLGLDGLVFFYRAMHCSEKRGIAIACRTYIRPSVSVLCNVGGSGQQVMNKPTK